MTAKSAVTPNPILILGSVPHFGLMVAEFFTRTSQVSLLLAEVHARYRSTISSDSPQLTVICVVPEEAARRLSWLALIVLAQANMGLLSISVPEGLYRFKVPHKAKAVLVEPVLFLIPNMSGLVPSHWQGFLSGAGNVALINSRSLDVQLLGDGKVCARLLVLKKVVSKPKMNEKSKKRLC